jgi:F0F1-type ATP synthase assembly protein I
MPLLDAKTLGDYARYSQMGAEMVAPIILGYLLDDFVFGSLPWLTIVGALTGLVWMLWRLSRLLEHDAQRKPPAKS